MSSQLFIPEDYHPHLELLEVEQAIKNTKDFFENNLAKSLNLTRVTAPLFVRTGTGINDDLNGFEQPVRFEVKNVDGEKVEMVQSLAKWKRLALARYGFSEDQGLYTDMNAVRPDEVLDNLHSIYVDQWDWEKVINVRQRNLSTLKNTVRVIYDVICRTEFYIASLYPNIRPVLPQDISFITAQELLDRYPDADPKERENMICEECKAVFVVGIGATLSNGIAHDGRAPDYDDWSSPRPDGGVGLNGDILVWHPVLEQAFEISSMGIRVDAESLKRQLAMTNNHERAKLIFHSKLLNGELPQTMGGGIGQSRLCMFFLRTAHIGEVAVGIWTEKMQEECSQANVFLL